MLQFESGRTSDATRRVNAPVFWPAAAIIVAFIVVTLTFVDQVEPAVVAIQSRLVANTGWLYILVVNLVLVFLAYLALGRFGRVRLGGPNAKPEFGAFAWFTMLFNAGIGLGLMAYSVAEPMAHYAAPPRGSGGTVQSASEAMQITFLHYGLHAWGTYALSGLSLAYFFYNRGLPLTLRSIFQPLLGTRIYGFWGHCIDVMAIVATLFGLATTLGLGIGQISAGLNHIFGTPHNVGMQIALIAIITGMATVSVVLGLDRGVKRLSEISTGLGILLMGIVLLLGPTVFLLRLCLQSVGSYLQRVVSLGTWAEALGTSGWQQDWTIFYWGWWIAWAPFVGMFIARISRGRTVREFLLGVLCVPTLFTFVWLSVFGGTAIHEELLGGGGIAQAAQSDMATSLYVLLERFPFSSFTSVLAVVVATVFFVTSSDSGSLVVDFIASGGHPNPPVKQRVFWAVMEGVVAAVLLLGGGLKALQTGSIATGLPFAVVMIVMCFSLKRALASDYGPAPEMHPLSPDAECRATGWSEPQRRPASEQPMPCDLATASSSAVGQRPPSSSESATYVAS